MLSVSVFLYPSISGGSANSEGSENGGVSIMVAGKRGAFACTVTEQ